MRTFLSKAMVAALAAVGLAAVATATPARGGHMAMGAAAAGMAAAGAAAGAAAVGAAAGVAAALARRLLGRRLGRRLLGSGLGLRRLGLSLVGLGRRGDAGGRRRERLRRVTTTRVAGCWVNRRVWSQPRRHGHYLGRHSGQRVPVGALDRRRPISGRRRGRGRRAERSTSLRSDRSGKAS